MSIVLDTAGVLAYCTPMADALTADPFALDPFIAALCDEAAAWLTMVATCAAGMGGTVAQGITALLAAERMHTGYQPEPQRRNVRHRMYRDGLRTPSRRPTAADRAKAEARAWGLA